jgi:hypothetical protein
MNSGSEMDMETETESKARALALRGKVDWHLHLLRMQLIRRISMLPHHSHPPDQFFGLRRRGSAVLWHSGAPVNDCAALYRLHRHAKP